jgi:hypothetical protein
MTNTHHKAARDLDKEKRAYADQLLESAARWGLIRDTGKRKWSERTRSYQIIWEAVPGKLPSDWDAWRKSQDKRNSPVVAFTRGLAHALTQLLKL